MAEPRIEIFQPQKRGEIWAAAARLKFPEGSVDIVARAPEKLVARQLARLQSVVAIHTAKGFPNIKFTRPSRSRVSGVGETTFWEDLAAGASDLFENEIFQNIINGVVSLVPVAGAIVVGSGLTGTGLNAAAAALDKAAGKGDWAATAIAAGEYMKEREAAYRKQQAELAAQQAEKAQEAGNKAASANKARKAIFAAEEIAKRYGHSGLRRVRGLTKAQEVAEKAAAGDKGAQAQVLSIADKAKAGDQSAMEAFAMLVSMMEYVLDMLEQELDTGVGLLTASEEELVRRLTELMRWKRSLRRLIKERGRQAMGIDFATAAAKAASTRVRRGLLAQIQRRARAS